MILIKPFLSHILVSVFQSCDGSELKKMPMNEKLFYTRYVTSSRNDIKILYIGWLIVSKK